MPEHKTDQERIDFALRTESDGSDFYARAKVQAGHKLARAAFEVLSREEMRHMALIEGLAKHLKGEGELAEPKSPTMAELETDLKTIYGDAMDEPGEGKMDPAEAYKRAIELEKKISALYFGYTSECDSDAAKRLFHILYGEEQRHLSLLQDMLAYLTKPDQWFIDKDGVMLDGG